MDSDDELQYANDSDVEADSDNNGDEYDYDGTTAITSPKPQQKNYTVLNDTDVRQRLHKDITAISNVLSVSTDSATILLRYYNWDVGRAQEEWFTDEEKARKAIGLLEKPVVQIQKKRKLSCNICFESYAHSKMDAAACGHPFCIECWTGYVTTAITDGAECLMLQCPEPSCNAVVGPDMVNRLVCELGDKEKYSRYLIRSYVEASRKTKWCPAPGCDYAVDFLMGGKGYDVTCTCSYGFCWNCTEEAHRPVDCETVARWLSKNSDESENTSWILAKTKPCPKCKKPIEKNNGCMHMTCRAPCKSQFCWLCLGDWKGHQGACNGYNKKAGVLSEDEKVRQRAQMYIERYTHYYERWMANHNSRRKALADLTKLQTVQIDRFRERRGKTEAELSFIVEAWQQIVECRRVLKWTYAYGYYLHEEDNVKKTQLFEYLQGEAESGLERLHQCAEKELEVHLGALGPSESFTEFKAKLATLTTVTKNYFENLVRALENGLSETELKWLCQYCTFANAECDTSCQTCGLYRFGSYSSIDTDGKILADAESSRDKSPREPNIEISNRETVTRSSNVRRSTRVRRPPKARRVELKDR